MQGLFDRSILSCYNWNYHSIYRAVLATWVIRPDLRGKQTEGGVLCCFTLTSGSSPMRKFLAWLQKRIQHRLKPAAPTLISGLLSDLPRSRIDLLVENALLRQQLIVLNRQGKRPSLTNPDRFRFVLLAHFTRFWKQALHIVQPDTLLRWHRERFRLHWRQKSQGKAKISAETIELIHKLARENRLWGAERI